MASPGLSGGFERDKLSWERDEDVRKLREPLAVLVRAAKSALSQYGGFMPDALQEQYRKMIADGEKALAEVK